MTSVPGSLYVGIDGGGTKTELLARRRDDARTVQRLGAKSNLQLVGLEETTAVLVDLIEQAASAFDDASLGAVCVGLSGAGRPHEQEAVQRRLAEQLEVSRAAIDVVSDAEIAVEAAFSGRSGVLVIAGTGSMVCARTVDNTFAATGGWGRVLGDEGSGYAIGRAGLQAVASAVDGGPQTTLIGRVAELFGDVSKAVLIRQVYGEDWPVQEFAPHVLAAAGTGDREANRILHEQTRMLARRVQWLIQGRADLVEQRLALTGGLSNSDIYRRAFIQSLDELVSGWHIQQMAAEPAAGALAMALSRA